MPYKRVLLKLSGEALLENENIISPTKLTHFVNEIKSIYDMGIKIGIVIGGGNILRGGNNSLNLKRYRADNIGMLSTVLNAIALNDYLEKVNISSEVLSSIEITKVCNFYTAKTALDNLANNKIVIFAGGIANPYFSTDTCAVIRALEIQADVVLKGTQVDGIYNKDPKTNHDATKYNEVSYDEVINKKLGVMDIASVILAQKEKLPIVIFNIHKAGNLKSLLSENNNCSIIK